MGEVEVAQQVSALAVRLFTNNIARSYSSEFPAVVGQSQRARSIVPTANELLAKTKCFWNTETAPILHVSRYFPLMTRPKQWSHCVHGIALC